MRPAIAFSAMLLAACGGPPGGSGPTAAPDLSGSGDDPSTRTDGELCARWKRDLVQVSPEWVGGAEACDPGEVPEEAQQNALRRANLYRWLVGLPPALREPVFDQAQQSCATILAASNRLSHQPGADWPCWTQKGALAAGQSNLAFGTHLGLADSVDAFVQDDGANNYDDVGHRRWILDPGMRSTTFGYRHPGTLAFGCMNVFDQLPAAERPDPEFVAYPPPGPFPEGAARGRRVTFASSRLVATPGVGVEVSIDGGPTSHPVVSIRPPNIGTLATVLIWDGPLDGRVPAGKTIAVRVRGLSRDGVPAEAAWVTRGVDCARP